MTSQHRHTFLNQPPSLKGFLLPWMILWGCFALPAWGQDAPQALPWSRLAPGEQTVLTPFKEQWESLPPSRQYRLQHGAQRYQQMSPTQQQHMRKQFNRWKDLSPEKQDHIRQRFKALGLSTASPSQTASTPRETSLVSGFTPGTPTGIKEAMEKPLSPKTASDPKPHGEITYPLSSTTALSTAMMVLLPYRTLLFFECLGYGFNPETTVGSQKSV